MKDKVKRTEKMTVAEAREVLRGLQLRGTAARIAVIQCLANSPSPLSHAEVTDQLAELGFDSSTIFRSLTELSEAGLFRRVDLGDGARRFEFSRESTDAMTHPHFLCLDCGKVTCLPGYTIELHGAAKGSVRLNQITEVLLKGHCTDCE
ncbi:MAG: transcriptional repressor [Pirellulales bacterium]